MAEPARRPPVLAAVYLLVLLTLIAVAVWRPLTGQDDFWSHAAVGRWIADRGAVPRETLFLWTASEPWVSHSWLSQLTFYSLTAAAPEEQLPTVVLAFTTLLVAAPYLVAWRLWASRSRISTAAFLLFALAVVAGFRRYQTRPELFSALFLVLLMAFLIADPASRRKGWLTAAVLVALFVAWANFHGGVLAGLVVLAATVVCDLLQDQYSKPARTMALLALLAPAAVCLNPHGLGYWGAFAEVGSYRFQCLTEWWPIWKAERLPVIELGVQALFLAVAVTAWSLNPQRRWAHLAWLVVLTALYVTATRNVWLLTLGCLMVLAANSGAVTFRRFREQLLPPVLLWVMRMAAVAGVGLVIAVRVVALEEWQFDYRPVQFDQGLLKFIETHRPPGRLFNDFENSRYLEYRLGGQPPLFIDAQMAYPDQVMRDYLDVLDATPRSLEVLDEYQIGYVLLTTERVGPRLGNLADLLDRDADWKRVYSGIDGLIWVRRSPAYRYLWDDKKLYVNSTPYGGWERLFRGGPEPHNSFFPE